MKGFPKIFTTKEDFYNVLEIGEFTDQVKAKLVELIEGRFIWVIEQEVHEGETYTVNDTHMLVESTTRDEETGEERKVFYQMIKVEDPNSELVRLGWTPEETRAFLEWEKEVEGTE